MITVERLKEVIHYNSDTGILTWLKKPCPRANNIIGSEAGSLNKDGYRRIMINRVLYRAHRLAFLYMEGYFPENDVDHINRIRDDNRWNNLRHVSRQCNSRNKGKQSNNTSGITGVSWHNRDKRWKAQIKVNQKNIYLGYFTTLRPAVQARWEAEKKYNFPNCNTASSAYNYLRDNKVLDKQI